MDTRRKILDPREAPAALGALLNGRAEAVLVRGWFDGLREAHARRLEELRQSGACIVVLLETERPGRLTALPVEDRAQLAAALEAVDYVVPCDETTAEALRAQWSAGRSQILPLVEAEPPEFPNLIEDVLQRHRGE